MSNGDAISARCKALGDEVRKLKAAAAPKADIAIAVKALLAAKAEYKVREGTELPSVVLNVFLYPFTCGNAGCYWRGPLWAR